MPKSGSGAAGGPAPSRATRPVNRRQRATDAPNLEARAHARPRVRSSGGERAGWMPRVQGHFHATHLLCARHSVTPPPRSTSAQNQHGPPAAALPASPRRPPSLLCAAGISRFYAARDGRAKTPSCVGARGAGIFWACPRRLAGLEATAAPPIERCRGKFSLV